MEKLNSNKGINQEIQIESIETRNVILPKLSSQPMDSYVNKVERVHMRKKTRVAVLQVLGVVFLLVILVLAKSQNGQAKVQQGIADQIIRFHVLANSDSEEDQAVKLKVKTKVVEYLQKQLTNCQSKEEAKAILRANFGKIQEIAAKVLKEEGFDYPVKVELATAYFPVKVYGDLTFPEGDYEALRVLIGEAKGKNWWCVMFPSLCFVNETYSVVPDTSKDTLRYVLSDEEYEEISHKENAPTNKPTETPTNKPTNKPAVEPTEEPTIAPTAIPSDESSSETGGKIKYSFWLFDTIANWF